VDHSACVLATQYDRDAHTHEGDKGFWRFASEVPANAPAWYEDLREVTAYAGSEQGQKD
jgi:hypothetical protein